MSNIKNEAYNCELYGQQGQESSGEGMIAFLSDEKEEIWHH